MICGILKVCYILDSYKDLIDAYINGTRGETLNRIYYRVLIGDDTTSVLLCRDYPKIMDLLNGMHDHIQNAEHFFGNRTSFVEILP